MRALTMREVFAQPAWCDVCKKPCDTMDIVEHIAEGEVEVTLNCHGQVDKGTITLRELMVGKVVRIVGFKPPTPLPPPPALLQ